MFTVLSRNAGAVTGAGNLKVVVLWKEIVEAVVMLFLAATESLCSPRSQILTDLLKYWGVAIVAVVEQDMSGDRTEGGCAYKWGPFTIPNDL